LTSLFQGLWISEARPRKGAGDYCKEQSMIRNLKILMAAAMALAALGAIGVSGAQAAEFHCSVEPCTLRLKRDGTAAEGKTAHQVIIFENKATTESVSFTCNEITGHATSAAKTFSTIEFTNIIYHGCTVNGSGKVVLDMNGCKYNFSAAGTMTITGCNAGKKIEFTLTETGCTMTIGEQGPLAGITYKTAGTSPNREVRLSTNVHGIVITADGTKAQCGIDPAQTLEGTNTTGNTLIRAETDVATPVMAEGWFE
jgi:hypothetical protein